MPSQVRGEPRRRASRRVRRCRWAARRARGASFLGRAAYLGRCGQRHGVFLALPAALRILPECADRQRQRRRRYLRRAPGADIPRIAGAGRAQCEPGHSHPLCAACRRRVALGARRGVSASGRVEHVGIRNAGDDRLYRRGCRHVSDRYALCRPFKREGVFARSRLPAHRPLGPFRHGAHRRRHHRAHPRAPGASRRGEGERAVRPRDVRRSRDVEHDEPVYAARIVYRPSRTGAQGDARNTRSCSISRIPSDATSISGKTAMPRRKASSPISSTSKGSSPRRRLRRLRLGDRSAAVGRSGKAVFIGFSTERRRAPFKSSECGAAAKNLLFA